MEMRFKGALITGASSGIGEAFALTLAQDADVILSGRDTARLDSLAERLVRVGHRVETVQADLSTAAGRSAVIAAGARGQIDLFVCNAGAAWYGDFCAASLEQERETVAVNVVATHELLHAIVPPMIAQAKLTGRRAGVIVVSSTIAFAGRRGLASYSASKAFQLRLVEALADELKGEPIDILALCPSATATNFFARAGMPTPAHAVTAGSIAKEAIAMLGRRTVHVAQRPAPVATRIFGSTLPRLVRHYRRRLRDMID